MPLKLVSQASEREGEQLETMLVSRLPDFVATVTTSASPGSVVGSPEAAVQEIAADAWISVDGLVTLTSMADCPVAYLYTC